MNRALLLAVALLGATVGCINKSTISTSRSQQKAMSCTLDICGDKQIQNPTETDIRQALLGLDTKKDGQFLILGPTDSTYIQTSGDQKVGFDMEYQEGDIKHHYRAKREFSADEVVRMFVSYMSGSMDWKQNTEWQSIRL